MKRGIKITPGMIANGEFILSDEERKQTEEEIKNGTFWKFKCEEEVES